MGKRTYILFVLCHLFLCVSPPLPAVVSFIQLQALESHRELLGLGPCLLPSADPRLIPGEEAPSS